MVRTFVKHAAAKPGKNGFKCGMRYEPGYLIEMLLLKMKSASAYRHIRDNGIMPMPDISTIRRLLSSSDCGFGFNQLALENIGRLLSNLGKHLRSGTLMWDEMSIRKDLTWDSKMMKWDGLVNFGSDLEEKPQEGLADHVLVLLFRPFRQNWVQPIGWFATKGAANYNVLSELIMKAIIMLHRSGALVKAIVCDGCASNKAMLSKLNINGMDNGRNFLVHPIDDSIKIYAFIDVPHLVKCTRNNILNHVNVQVRSDNI